MDQTQPSRKRKELVPPTLPSVQEEEDMIIQTIGLLDGLDKQLRSYAMRVRKCYGRHFPELEMIVQDNILYAKAVKLMGRSTNAANLDFSEILPVKVETELKEAAMTSMRTEVSDLYMMNINNLCDKVVSLSENRAQHFDHLKSWMKTIAPNLTALVGELVGARLIARGGGLLNLAMQPVKYGRIRALNTEQASRKHKAKIARSIGAKVVLAIRCDVFGDKQDNLMGLAAEVKPKKRLRKLEAVNKDHKEGSSAFITPAKIEVEAEKDEEMVAQGEATVDEKEDTAAKLASLKLGCVG